MSKQSKPQNVQKGKVKTVLFTALAAVVVIITLLLVLNSKNNERGSTPEASSEPPAAETQTSEITNSSDENSDTINFDIGIYTPDAEDIESAGVKRYRGTFGTYTFGLDKQPESIIGICLAPTYRASNGDQYQVGMSVMQEGCALYLQGKYDNEYTQASVVAINTSLDDLYAIQYQDEVHFGVAWYLDELGGDYTAAETSFITLRCVNMETQRVIDLIKLTFSKDENGKYAIVSITSAEETNAGVIELAAEELNQMISLAYKEEKNLERNIPVSTSKEFGIASHGTDFFVQKVSRSYSNSYIDAVTGEEKHFAYLWSVDELYAITANIGGEIPYITLYMVPNLDNNGIQFFETVGFEITR